MCIYIYTYNYMYIHTYIYIHIHTYTYIYLFRIFACLTYMNYLNDMGPIPILRQAHHPITQHVHGLPLIVRRMLQLQMLQLSTQRPRLKRLEEEGIHPVLWAVDRCEKGTYWLWWLSIVVIVVICFFIIRFGICHASFFDV